MKSFFLELKTGSREGEMAGNISGHVVIPAVCSSDGKKKKSETTLTKFGKRAWNKIKGSFSKEFVVLSR